MDAKELNETCMSDADKNRFIKVAKKAVLYTTLGLSAAVVANMLVVGGIWWIGAIQGMVKRSNDFDCWKKESIEFLTKQIEEISRLTK